MGTFDLRTFPAVFIIIATTSFQKQGFRFLMKFNLFSSNKNYFLLGNILKFQLRVVSREKSEKIVL